MELTPRKSSLRSTPKGKGLVPLNNDDSPKKVRFSVLKDSLKVSHEKKVDRKIITPEDILSVLYDSSLSELDKSSSDEEWIVTKANTKKSSTYNEEFQNKSNPTPGKTPKSENIIVSPLKLLRKPEYEVNKLPSENKKSESAVSPIVIKRKKDSMKFTKNSLSGQPLTSSSKYNTVDAENTVQLVNFSQKPSDALKKDESDTENEISTPKKKSTPCKQASTRSNILPKGKEKRKKSDLEDSFEEKISNLRIKCTPKKIEINSDNKLESFVSPPKRKSIHTPIELGSNNLRRSTRLSTSQYKTLVISDSDSEMEYTKSPICNRKSKLTSKVILNGNNDMSCENVSSPEIIKTPKQSVRLKISDSDSEMEDTKSPICKRKSRQSSKVILNEKNDMSCENLSSPEIKKTPKQSLKIRESVDSPSLRRQVLTPRKSARKKLDLSSPSSVKKVGSGFLSPAIHEKSRQNLLGTSGSHIAEIRASLHTSHVPTSLPCREKEFENILKFLSRKIEDRAGGCMYISGVPGTGKTATVHAVVRTLQGKATTEDISKFDFVEINALRLTEPRQAYTRIWRELSGEKISADAAMKALEKKYAHKNKRPSVILIDELDYLCNRRQDVIYNILEWSTKSTAALSVITIANTMDLPERTLKGKVTSRMGLTRLVFQPYTFQQLQQIVMNRIGDSSNFHVDAVQLVARKVAAVSGDARRALDICRRATELLTSESDPIGVTDIEKAISKIFAGTRVQAIKKCSIMCQYLLRAMRDEFQRTGVEESSVGQVYTQFSSICAFEGCEAPSVGVFLSMCTVLADSGLILGEKSRTDLNRKLSLNVSADDIFYACNA